MSGGDLVIFDSFKKGIREKGIHPEASVWVQLVNAKKKKPVRNPKIIAENCKVFVDTGRLDGRDVAWDKEPDSTVVTHAVIYAEKDGKYADMGYVELGKADLSSGTLTIQWRSSGIMSVME